MILLSAEKRLKVGEIAEIVRESEITVLRWLKRYMAESVAGLQDAPRSGRKRTVTANYREKLVEAVRRRPRSLALISRCGPCNASSITWRKRPASESPQRQCDVP